MFFDYWAAWLLIVVFIYGTIQRNKIWAGGPVAVWADVVKKSPNKVRGHINLAMAYIHLGDRPNALKEIQTVLRLVPKQDLSSPEAFDLRAAALTNLSQMMIDSGMYGEAIRALQAEPRWTAPMRVNMAVAYMRMGRLIEANNILQDGLKQYGETDESAMLWFNAAQIVHRLIGCADAKPIYQRAHRLYADLPNPC